MLGDGDESDPVLQDKYTGPLGAGALDSALLKLLYHGRCNGGRLLRRRSLRKVGHAPGLLFRFVFVVNLCLSFFFPVGLSELSNCLLFLCFSFEWQLVVDSKHAVGRGGNGSFTASILSLASLTCCLCWVFPSGIMISTVIHSNTVDMGMEGFQSQLCHGRPSWNCPLDNENGGCKADDQYHICLMGRWFGWEMVGVSMSRRVQGKIELCVKLIGMVMFNTRSYDHP